MTEGEVVPPADRGLDLHLDLVGETRPARALERALREAILSGRLPVGRRLPPSRSLAGDLGVARATVSDVYAQLAAEGWLDARVGAGTWVARGRIEAPVTRVAPAPSAPQPASMVAGLPDPSAFPRREWLAAARKALEAATVTDLGYADIAGEPRLRRALAGYLVRTRGVEAGTDDLLVGHGFGGMLSLICQTLARQGAHRVAVESHGHPQHREIVRAAGLDVVVLPVDYRGAVIEDLPGGTDAVVLTPAHQFPLGWPLSAERRRRVVAWARREGALVIEDDYDGEFRYDRRSIGALQGIGPDVVAYLGTASKAIAPALGLSWAVVPRRLRPALLRQRDVLDLPRDAINQLTLAQFLTTHAYDRQVRRMRQEYRRRRALLEAEVTARVPDATVMGVAAGLQATIRLPDGVDADEAVAEGLRRGVAFRTLADYAAVDSDLSSEAVVIGYGAPPASRAARDIGLVVAALAGTPCRPDRR